MCNAPLPLLFEDIENLRYFQKRDMEELMPIDSVENFKKWIQTKTIGFEILRKCLIQATVFEKNNIAAFIINETVVAHLLTYQDTLATCLIISFKTRNDNLFFDIFEFLLKIRRALEMCATDEEADHFSSGGAKRKTDVDAGILYEFIPRSVKHLFRIRESTPDRFERIFLHLDFAINTAITLSSRSKTLDLFEYILRKFVGGGDRKYITTEMFSGYVHNTNFYRHGALFNSKIKREKYFRLIDAHVPGFFWESWLASDEPLMRLTSTEISAIKILSSLSSASF